MANELFLNSSFIRIFDIYDNYSKKYNDYSISFEQFYMSLYQNEINLYFHTHNIGVKTDIAIFPERIGDLYRYGDDDIKLYMAEYKKWVRENQDRITSINKTLDEKINKFGLHGGIFFKLKQMNYIDIKMGRLIPLEFLPIDLHNIHGELIFSHDEVYSVCEQYFQDEDMPDINIAPTEFIAILDRAMAVPEMKKDDATGLNFIKISESDIFIKNHDAFSILRNNFRLDVENSKEILNLEKKMIGVSKDKIEAKKYAKNIADYLWRKDVENKIKIKEMSINVYVELNQTIHRDQLPDQPESLKDWIKDIAPDYAKESGRPRLVKK
ncbi:MAG: hypothetical protein RRZ32_04960 [Acinetobacter sp.]